MGLMLVCIESRTREPFDISTLGAPRDHIVFGRRLEFTRQRGDEVLQPVRPIQIDKSGADVRLTRKDTGRLAREPPVADKPLEGTDCGISWFIIANGETV